MVSKENQPVAFSWFLLRPDMLVISKHFLITFKEQLFCDVYSYGIGDGRPWPVTHP